jgi:glycosyltransferase involved in cell wall biosynthesis
LDELFYANLRRKDCPIIYMNYFLPLTFSRGRFPTGVVIHDCQHRALQQNFSSRKRAWLDHNFQRTLDKADQVYLISEFERGQIARFYGEKRAGRCEVIYNPVDFARYEHGEVGERVQDYASRRFILLVAYQTPHKNTQKSIAAFAQLCERDPDTVLVIVGRPSAETTRQLETEVPDAVRPRVVQTSYVTDRELGELYRKCALYVTASSYEGFGMPPVEAMGLGAPVLVTDGTSLPEVTLRRGQYVREGASAAEWAEAMEACLANRPSDAYLDESARLVRARYAPEAVARRVIDTLPL